MSATGDDSLDVKFWKISEDRRVAYVKRDGDKRPGIVFFHGFLSSMLGTKPTAIDKFCRKKGYPFLKFDYEGMGQSSGKINNMTLNHWKEDALGVIDNFTDGPQILVGSSLGGWLMTLVALERPQRIQSMIGIASAINFPEQLYKMLTPKLKAKLDSESEVTIDGPYGPYVITKLLIEEGRKHSIDLKVGIPIHCPVRLIHGLKDDVIPYTTTIELAQCLASNDVDVILRRDGQHRMSEPQDLTLMINTIASLVDKK